MNRLPVHHKAFNILYFFSFNFTPTEISILDKFSGVLFDNSIPLNIQEGIIIFGSNKLKIFCNMLWVQ